jgi:glycerophosphoryl diester phosphodiesterase
VNCIAHRGFAATIPENTVRAVREAVAAGADAVEVDVRRCGSGEVVVVHDATVDRVTDGTGTVADHSRSELTALDVLDTDEGIPTLAEVVAALDDGVGLNVELKETGLAADTLAVISDHGGDVLLSSFEADALREARDAGTASLALLFASDSEGALDAARSLECRAVHPHREFCDASFVERCHGEEFAVNAWTVRSRDEARRLRAAGVDGLIADAPAYCRAADVPSGDGDRETD